MTQITSFDVFDTLLTRAVGSPTAIFLPLGKQLAGLSLIDCTPEAFARARITAERLAYSNASEPDKVTLRQIYVELGVALRLTETQCNQLMRLECALEAELIRAVPGATDRVRAARCRGHRVVFTSDMYLPAEFVQKQLMRHGLWVDGDTCYISCERGKSKASGELFEELLRCEGVSPEVVSHCGNDPKADVQAAKSAGLQVEPFLDGNLNRYERILESYTWATEGLSSVMAGASRMARLTVPASNAKQEAVRDVSAGVVAPLLVGYTLWILQRAQQLGLKRLYFVSRDGQILLEIARRLVSKLNISCELCYLYGSRQSWNLPAITRIDEEQLLWSWDSTDFLSVKSWLSRVGVEPDDVKETLHSVGLAEEDLSRNLSRRERDAMRTVLREDERLQELILQRAAQKRQVIIAYFKQAGLLDPTECAMVDVGWNGSMYYSLARVLTSAGARPPVGLYFGMTGNRPLDRRFDIPETYFFNERLGVGFVQIPGENGLKIFKEKYPYRGLVIMLEVFCSADHGTVVEFVEEGGKVRPVLKEERNQPVIEWGFPTVRETIYSFAENLVLDSSLVNPGADVRAASAEVFKAFWLDPLPSEAMAWGDFPFEDGLSSEGYWNRLAARYRWTHVAKAFQTGKIFKPHRLTWVEGSVALTSPEIRSALKGVFRLRGALSGVKSAVRRVVNRFRDRQG